MKLDTGSICDSESIARGIFSKGEALLQEVRALELFAREKWEQFQPRQTSLDFDDAALANKASRMEMRSKVFAIDLGTFMDDAKRYFGL